MRTLHASGFCYRRPGRHYSRTKGVYMYLSYDSLNSNTKSECYFVGFHFEKKVVAFYTATRNQVLHMFAFHKNNRLQRAIDCRSAVALFSRFAGNYSSISLMHAYMYGRVYIT